MKAAGLKAIDTVVSSTAVLVKSKHPSNPELVDLIASRIRGVISMFICRHVVPSLILSSGTKVRSLPIQCGEEEPASSSEDYTRQARTDDKFVRGGGLGCSQCYGGEKEDRTRHG